MNTSTSTTSTVHESRSRFLSIELDQRENSNWCQLMSALCLKSTRAGTSTNSTTGTITFDFDTTLHHA